jgi:esterase/lipase
MKRRFGAGIASLALAGMIVGGATASALADPLSGKEFKKQANAICAQGNQQIEAAAQQAFGNLPQGQQPTPEEVQAFAAVAFPNIKQQIDSIAALDPPKSLKAKVKKLIKSARSALAKLEADPTLLADEKHDPFASANKQAKKLGLKECADDSSS